MKSDEANSANSAIERKTRAVFDESVAGTDAATRSRLTRARHHAMAELATPASRWRSSWLPAGAAAAAAMLVLVMLLGRAPQDGAVLDSAVATDLEILLDQDDLELIEELAFYAWLDEQPELKEVAGDDNGIG